MLLLNIEKLKTHIYLKNLLDKDTTFLNTKYTRLQSKGGDVYVTINTTIFQLGTSLKHAIEQNDDEFDIGVSGSQFFAAIGALSGVVARFRVEDTTLFISDDNTRIRLPIITGVEIDAFDKDAVYNTLTYATFKVGDLAKLNAFTTNDNTAFAGVNMHIDKVSQTLSFFATNRHHVAILNRSGNVIPIEDINLILPKEVISALSKLGADTEITVSRNKDTGQVYFIYGVDGGETFGHIVTRTLNFEPITVDRVLTTMSADDVKLFTINRTEVKDAVTLLKTLTADTTVSLKIKESGEDATLVIDHPDFRKRLYIKGKVDEEIDVSVDVDGFLAGLSTFDNDYIELRTNNAVPLVMLTNLNNTTIHAKKRRF